MDPMLATGNSAIAAIDRLMKDKPTKLALLVIGRSEGSKLFTTSIQRLIFLAQLSMKD